MSLKLSRKPKISVVSDAEKRSAEDGKGGGFGKRFDNEGSNENSKSAKGTGGWSGGCWDDMVVKDEDASAVRG